MEEGVALEEGEGDELGLTLGEGVTELLPDGETLVLGETVGVTVTLAVTLVVGLVEGLGEGLGEGSTPRNIRPSRRPVWRVARR